MTKVAIVYHSGFGHTAVLANEVARGVEQAGAEPVMISVEAGQTDFTAASDAVTAADAVIFGSPTYMGTVSAPMKAFMDGCGQAYLHKMWKDKIASGFTVSSSPSGDKLHTLMTFVLFAGQHGMVWVGTGSNPGANDDDDASVDAENRLGSYIGAMAQASNASPDVTPKAGDKATAASLGARVAWAAKRWHAGA